MPKVYINKLTRALIKKEIQRCINERRGDHLYRNISCITQCILRFKQKHDNIQQKKSVFYFVLCYCGTLVVNYKYLFTYVGNFFIFLAFFVNKFISTFLLFIVIYPIQCTKQENIVYL